MEFSVLTLRALSLRVACTVVMAEIRSLSLHQRFKHILRQLRDDEVVENILLTAETLVPPEKETWCPGSRYTGEATESDRFLGSSHIEQLSAALLKNRSFNGIVDLSGNPIRDVDLIPLAEALSGNQRVTGGPRRRVWWTAPANHSALVFY